MKQLGRMKAAALLVAFLASLTLGLQAEVKQGKAEVKAIRGAAQYALTGNDWQPLKVGMILKPGATVRTAADGSVDLFLGLNGPVLRVTPGTTLALDKLTYTKTDEDTVIETEMNLTQGTILGNVKKLAAASKYEVKTPNGVAAVRGTRFQITANGGVLVADGSIRVTYYFPNGGSITVTVNKNQMFVPPVTPEQIARAQTDPQSTVIDADPNDVGRVIGILETVSDTGWSGTTSDGGRIDVTPEEEKPKEIKPEIIIRVDPVTGVTSCFDIYGRKVDCSTGQPIQ